MSFATIFIIDDDIEIQRLVLKTLEPAGYKVKFADKLKEPLRQIFSSRCDLVILGEKSIDASYVRILNNLRAWSTVPVIVLSSIIPEREVCAVSIAGANGYITIPCSREEILSSVRTTLRSYNNTDQGATFEIDSVSIDFENHAVKKKGQNVELTPTEFSLLSLFVRNAGKLLTHDYILRHLRGPWFEKKTPYSHVYVGRLRRKLENNPGSPQLFQTELGRGYTFVAKQ